MQVPISIVKTNLNIEESEVIPLMFGGKHYIFIIAAVKLQK